jgi:hypothetical protein
VNVIGRPEDVTATELSILEQEFASSYNALGSLTCPGVRTIQEVSILTNVGDALLVIAASYNRRVAALRPSLLRRTPREASVFAFESEVSAEDAKHQTC